MKEHDTLKSYHEFEFKIVYGIGLVQILPIGSNSHLLQPNKMKPNSLHMNDRVLGKQRNRVKVGPREKKKGLCVELILD